MLLFIEGVHYIEILVSTLNRKYRLAIEGEEKTRAALEKFSVSVRQEWINEWIAAEKVALQLRGDRLLIYDIDGNKGNNKICILHVITLLLTNIL